MSRVVVWRNVVDGGSEHREGEGKGTLAQERGTENMTQLDGSAGGVRNSEEAPAANGTKGASKTSSPQSG